MSWAASRSLQPKAQTLWRWILPSAIKLKFQKSRTRNRSVLFVTCGFVLFWNSTSFLFVFVAKLTFSLRLIIHIYDCHTQRLPSDS